MYDSLSITQMYTSSREIWKINQSLGDMDLGFWMCPFCVSIHTQYTRVTILAAHPLKNQSSCYICCLSPHPAITCGTTMITAEDVCHFGFEPKFNYSLSDKIHLRMNHILHYVLQILEVSTLQFCPSLPLFPPFYVEILSLRMFLPPVHADPPHQHLN